MILENSEKIKKTSREVFWDVHFPALKNHYFLEILQWGCFPDPEFASFSRFACTPDDREPFAGQRRGFCPITCNPLELSKVHPDIIVYDDRV